MSFFKNNIFSILERVMPPSPAVMSVRFAEKVKRPTKFHYEYTNAALWRKSKGDYSNPNKYGPLTNLPDYSYLDGRPVPLGINQKLRLEKQKEYADTITRLSGEIDFARERHRQRVAFKEQRKREIIENKLNKKGPALLNKGKRPH